VAVVVVAHQDQMADQIQAVSKLVEGVRRVPLALEEPVTTAPAALVM